jgi:hypothetical protein
VGSGKKRKRKRKKEEKKKKKRKKTKSNNVLEPYFIKWLLEHAWNSVRGKCHQFLYRFL